MCSGGRNLKSPFAPAEIRFLFAQTLSIGDGANDVRLHTGIATPERR